MNIFDAEDMGRHPRLLNEHILMSSAIISQVERKNFDADFITKVLVAGENDQEWQERRAELERLQNEGKEFPRSGYAMRDYSTTKTDCISQKATSYTY